MQKEASRLLINGKPAACISEMSNKLRLAIHTCTHLLGIPPNIFVLDEVTSNQLNQLDQILIQKNVYEKQDYSSTSYINFTSDHKAIRLGILTVLDNQELCRDFDCPGQQEQNKK